MFQDYENDDFEQKYNICVILTGYFTIFCCDIL